MAEVKLPDYNAMPHLPPAELIAKATEQRFSGWSGIGAAPTPSMAEVKRYTPLWNSGLMEPYEGGDFVQICDYTALERKCQDLEREVERLRKIEAAAIKLVKCKGRYHTEQNYNAIAAALGDGRKG